ncbi:MAG: hypothetical protein ACLQPN_22565 [Bryobacteraceae bacterium]
MLTGVVFTKLVMRPKVAGDEAFRLGLPSSGWLNTLKTSPRKIKFIRSMILVCFASAASIWNSPGPVAIFRPASPHVPAGAANAATLTNR